MGPGEGQFRAHLITAGQTRLNGGAFFYDRAPQVGSVWQWQGRAISISRRMDDGAQAMAVALPQAVGDAPVPHRAGRAAQRLFRGTAFGRRFRADTLPSAVGPTIWLADVLRSFRVGVHRRARNGQNESEATLLVFEDGFPPVNRPLRVIRVEGYDRPGVRRHTAISPMTGAGSASSVLTPQGFRPLADLRPGDTVTTRDAGDVVVVDVRHQKLTGARLRVMPETRPVLMTLPADLPVPTQGGLRLAPNQHVLFRGLLPQQVFGTSEVLIEAGSLARHGLASFEPAVNRQSFTDIVLERPHVICVDGLDVLAATQGGTADGLQLAHRRTPAKPGPGPAPARLLDSGEAEILLGGSPIVTRR